MSRGRIIVGMSGGVDSSVAALRLRDAGHEVEGLFMFNWGEDEAGRCQAAEDYEDARAVAELIGIPLHRADFSSDYKQGVFQHFLTAYQAGRTPNPDVLCNREIKFNVFLNHAQRLGAARIATGHYARTRPVGDRQWLLRGVDDSKDQSYFLAAVPEAALARSLFPLGDMAKTDVRERARSAGLPVFDKPDSTGVCFIGERDFAGFLGEYLSGRPGPVRVADDGPLFGAVVGEHRGLIYHTLGQRRGLGLGGVRGADESPWYVVQKTLSSQTLWVSQDATHPALMSRKVEGITPHWIGEPPDEGREYGAQLRYRQASQPCRVLRCDTERVTLAFSHPQRAATPGQYAVVYDGERCLGAAEIAATDAPVISADKAQTA
ncbi:MAG: tRNA 2-thiouridine(34) synthase MnmA [Salinisphaeraceae bacterium]|nr:tRNA 2-thiouridine(34) synthase MnmA [Salinisphaeraceae bacterium]